jgi:hypothetical protein
MVLTEFKMAEEQDLQGIDILVDYLDNPINIAEMLDDDILLKIGSDAVAGYQADLDSMEDWVRVVEKGQELIKPEILPKTEPWPNAANFKSPVIIDAGLKFGDRASSELLRGDELVRTKTIGKDPAQAKQSRSDRVAMYMNWQLTSDMTEWVKEQNKLFYDLPYAGCIFKKVFFSREKQRNVSELIRYPAFAVNHNADSLEKARRFTHIMEFSKNETIEKQRGGIWLDIDVSQSSEGSAEQAESDKISMFLEQQTWIDLDGDGYEEPYTVLVHLGTAKVLRIVPRFNAEGVLLKDDKNDSSAFLSDLIKIDEGTGEVLGLPKSGGHREVVKITPINNIVQYGFLHNPDGGLLDVGYFHLLAGINGAINLTTNSLLNAGNLANLQGGWLAKGFRDKLGNMKTKPGTYQQTNLSAQDLQTGIREYNFKEPSPTLFQLNQSMIQSAEKTSASADLSGVLGANAPATTTLALVQEQQQSSGAIIMRIYRAETEEFKMLYKLNSEFLDEEEYKNITDDEDASANDFNLDNMDIVPVANPEISSKIQRLQLAQAELSQLGSVQAAGGNIEPVVKNFFEALGTQNIDEIFPEISEEEQQQQAQVQQAEIEEQEALQEVAIDLQERKQANEDAKTLADVEESQAKTIKLLEEAETEETKNLSNMYTTAVELDQRDLQLQQQKGQIDGANSRANKGVETKQSDRGNI